MLQSIDQLGRSIELSGIPKRIISLVPSQTELLFDLGLDQEIIGVTKFCIHPKSRVKEKTIIGGTKKINIEKIKLLSPDLIIANKEENNENQIQQLAEQFPLWISDIHNLDEALNMISEIGLITEKSLEAKEICNSINESFESFKNVLPCKKSTVVYLIWKDPYMTVGQDTFIFDMLRRCGYINLPEDSYRYPELTLDQISNLEPNYIFLSTEPYPFSEKHILDFKKLYPNSNVVLVDGEMFSWYGSRLRKAPDYFRSIIQEINSGS